MRFITLMDDWKLTLPANITKNGAVLLGKYVACDAHDDSRPLRVVTHAHSDHMGGLSKSLKHCDFVLMTQATKDLIDMIKGPLFLLQGEVKTIGYGERFLYEDERITFYPADHILGAAQVLVEDAEGNRILYTGDFRMPKTPVIKTDVLVMEATYGNPFKIRPFKREVQEALVSLVEKGLSEGPVYVFGYYGKLQEAMQILRENKVKVPFIVPEKVFQVCKVCEKHGMRLGRYFHSRSEQAKAMKRRKASFVGFFHMNSSRKLSVGHFSIYLSGWEFRNSHRQIGEKAYVVALSDHCDFEGLLEYVRRSKPRLVITDNARVGEAKTLAREIKKRMGIEALALPS